MTNENTSLSLVIKEQSSLLSVIGVFGVIATYFQSLIDTTISFETSYVNRAYIMTSFFSYVIVLLLLYELEKNIIAIKDKSVSVKTFNIIFIYFFTSMVFIVLSVHKNFILMNLHSFVILIFGVITTLAYIFLYERRIKPIEKYKSLRHSTRLILYYIGLFVVIFLSMPLSKLITNILLNRII